MSQKRNRAESQMSRKSVRIVEPGKSGDFYLNGHIAEHEGDDLSIPSITLSSRLRAESLSAQKMRADSMKVIELEEELTEPSPILRRTSTKEFETHWGSLWLANIMCFFIALSFTMFFPTIWPFLNVIDPTASEVWLGYIVAAYSLGQAIASPLFGFWSNHIHQAKLPMGAGMFIMFLSNLLYCFTESFPQQSRKWVLMAARFLCGLGAGVVALLRAYAATASNVRDRARAISLVTAAFTLGLAVGPGIQAAFAPIKHPGWVIGVFHLDMYTAAAFFSIIVDVVVFIFLLFLFKEHYAGIAPASARKNPFYALPKFDVPAVCVCIFTWFIMMAALTNLETIQSPYSMAMWDWTDAEASTYNSALLAVAAFVSFVTYALFAWKIGAKVDERKAVLVGIVLVILFHLFTYPWPFLTENLNLQLIELNLPLVGNATITPHIGEENETLTGCQSTKMEWCTDTKRVNMWLYFVCDVLLAGIGFPVINVPLSVLFSKIIGPRRQGTMQGFLLQSGSLARTVGPILVTYIFTNSGPKLTWGIEMILLAISIIPWLLYWKKMVPLQKRSKLKGGQHYRYKHGMLYKF